MDVAGAHRLRWILVAALVGAWLAGLVYSWLGDRLHLLLLTALVVLVYELLAEDPPAG